MPKIGFTGSQNGLTRSQRNSLYDVFKLLSIRGGVELHHGDCVGADAAAHNIAEILQFRIVGHPPTNSSKRAFCEFDEVHPRADYLVRNQHIVGATSILVACPSGPEVLRSGTWATVRVARKLGRRIILIPPDGNTVEDKK